MLRNHLIFTVVSLFFSPAFAQQEPLEEITFTKVYQVIEARCTMCHGDFGPKGLNMGDEQQAYDHLVDIDSVSDPQMKRVAPGQPDFSFLICKVIEDNACRAHAPNGGRRMPLAGRPLAPEEIQLISDWIAGGAKR